MKEGNKSKGSVLLVGLIVIIIIAVAAYFVYNRNHPQTAVSNQTTGQNATDTNPAANPISPVVNAQTSSDTALQSDSAALDSQMNGLANDNSAVDTSLTDNPDQAIQ